MYFNVDWCCSFQCVIFLFLFSSGYLMICCTCIFVNCKSVCLYPVVTSPEYFTNRLRRPVGRMTAEEQHHEGEFRFVNSRLITNRCFMNCNCLSNKCKWMSLLPLLVDTHAGCRRGWKSKWGLPILLCFAGSSLPFVHLPRMLLFWRNHPNKQNPWLLLRANRKETNLRVPRGQPSLQNSVVHVQAHRP